jgi:hypothetical protein
MAKGSTKSKQKDEYRAPDIEAATTVVCGMKIF